MRKAHLLIFLTAILALSLSSCVTNKKIVFFQKNDLAKKDLPKDTIMREYNLVPFDYKIQTYDNLLVRYQSLTSKEFDYLNQLNSNTATQGSIQNGDLVDENGEIPMLGAGKVKVAGLTLFEVQDKLQSIASQYFESPIVKVRLMNYRVTVLGEVNREGQVAFINTNRASFPEAIGLAGGFSDLSDRTNVKVLRQNGSKVDVYYVNLLKEDFLNSPFYYVHQNDVIIVPPLKQRAFRKYFVQNITIVLSALSLVLVLATLKK